MLLGRLLDRLESEHDADTRRQAFVLLVFSALLVVQCCAWCASHAAAGHTTLALAFGCCGVATLLVLWLVFRGLSLAVAGHVTLALAFMTVVVATWHTGGLRLTNVCPFLSLIIAAIFVRSRSGLPWAITALVVPLGFQVAGWAGFEFPDLVAAEDREMDAFLTWAITALLILLYGWLYDAARERATQRAEEASRAKDQFLANLSHEIRNPLHVMMALHAQLERSPRSGREAEILDVMSSSAGHLKRLLTDLLELARGEARGFNLDAEDFDPVVVFETVRRVLDERCRTKGLYLRARVAAEVPRRLCGDAARVIQVLMNLADNAVKYTARGEVRFEMLADPRAAQGLLIRVADTGIGVPQPEQARIFDAFTRAETSLASECSGVGLGLSIARRLVEAMGGSIMLSSEPGRGSTFEVRIPFAAARGTLDEAEPAAIASPRSAPVRVLLAEDNDFNRDVTRLMLERLGFDVLLANDGAEAVSLWQERRPAVVLMDVQMPGMDGLAAAREIRRREREHRGAPTVILATTGYSTTSSERDCMRAGTDGVLLKPFSEDDLRRLVQTHLPGAS